MCEFQLTLHGEKSAYSYNKITFANQLPAVVAIISDANLTNIGYW